MFSAALSQSISPPVAVFSFCLLLFSIIYRALFVLLPAAVVSVIYLGSQSALSSRNEALGPPSSVTLITAAYLRDGLFAPSALPLLPQLPSIFLHIIYFIALRLPPCLSLQLTSPTNEHDGACLVQ